MTESPEKPPPNAYLILLLKLAALVALGTWSLWLPAWSEIGTAMLNRPGGLNFLSGGPSIPSTKMPGPPRNEVLEFKLDASNSGAMTGSDDPTNERRRDVAGNQYSDEFLRKFTYANPGSTGPEVRVQVNLRSHTFSGRLEARGLKPNFAYQMKLSGDFQHREAFEIIGSAGRWRLPGRGTNYSDADYHGFKEKSEVEAYILFDYFATDAKGNAVREFSLDSTLHVLWNASRAGPDAPDYDVIRVHVTADNPAVYSVPKSKTTVERVFAEREHRRYTSADQIIRLPERSYRAFIILTEETFHSKDRDGGHWPTVFKMPVAFTVDLKHSCD